MVKVVWVEHNMPEQAGFRKRQIKHYQAFMILGVVALWGYGVFHAVVEADWLLAVLDMLLGLDFRVSRPSGWTE